MPRIPHPLSRAATIALALSFVALAAGCDATGVVDADGGIAAASRSADRIAEINAADAAEHTYHVTIDNLTKGQPLSTPVIATHTQSARFFEVGAAASEGIRLIAESGQTTVAVAEMEARAGVLDVVARPGAIHRVGGPGPSSRTYEVQARANANRLSLATMLVCTNDGFTGLDGVMLPRGFRAETYYAVAYDAGTEANIEQTTYLTDSCNGIGPVPFPLGPDGNMRAPEDGVIRKHPGIAGGAFLVPAAHGWDNPVIRVTVQRIR